MQKQALVDNNNIGVSQISPDVEGIWSQLATNTRQQDPFCCSPNWQMSFHNAFSPRRKLLIKACSDGLIAFAEKKFSRTNFYLTPIEPHWFFGNPLLGEGAVKLLAETLNDFSSGYPNTLPKIIISGIAPNGSVLQKLKKVFGQRFDFYKHSSGVQCSASLNGGIDGYLSRRSANHRRKLKKAMTKAKRTGLNFERNNPITEEDANAIFYRMTSVEMASWKGIRNCGMVGGSNENFYRIMLRNLSRSNDSRLIFAQFNGEDIGFIFGGMVGAAYRGQQFSFDDEWRNYSIGNLMQFEQIKWLCEEGATRYDMGPLIGNRMGYKRHWTERKNHIETWVLQERR